MKANPHLHYMRADLSIRARETWAEDVHIPITPPQSSGQTDAATQESTISMPCSAFEGIPLIFEQAGLFPGRR